MEDACSQVRERTDEGKRPEQSLLQFTISSLDWPHTSWKSSGPRDARPVSHSVHRGWPVHKYFFVITAPSHSQFTPCLDGKSTVTTCRMLMNSRCSCWARPRHEATVSWCVAVTCGEDAGCFPTRCVVKLKPEVNLCAKFSFVYICQHSRTDPLLLYVLFSVSFNHDSNPGERLSEAAEYRSQWEHCMSSEDAPDLLRNVKLCEHECVCVCKCLCTIFSSLQAQTVQVKKHNCQSFQSLGC